MLLKYWKNKRPQVDIEYPPEIRDEIERKSYLKDITNKNEKDRLARLTWMEGLAEFLNGPSEYDDPNRKYGVMDTIWGTKEREKTLAGERYRMEKFWKPLWKIFLGICVIYTVLHVLQIGPVPMEDFYENIR